MYTGELPKDYDTDKDAIPLMSIAHKYQIESLMDFDVQQMIDRFTSITDLYYR
jgi:hypothetical protein